jgi:hypothetical protein
VFPVLLVYAGIALGVAGALGIARPASFIAAAAAVVLGLVWPARDRRVAARESRLDELVPVWQFSERHRRRMRVPNERLRTALLAVTAREIAGFRLLTWLRNPPWPGRRREENILAAPPDEPLLAVALRSGFTALGERPDEVVLGMLVIAPGSLGGAAARRRFQDELSPDAWPRFDSPGFAKAAMNFRWREDGDGWTEVTTETRIAATDAGARRRFAWYWRLIYPGSSWLRHTWLRAIERRARRQADPA